MSLLSIKNHGLTLKGKLSIEFTNGNISEGQKLNGIVHLETKEQFELIQIKLDLNVTQEWTTGRASARVLYILILSSTCQS